jgi:hypothetical protein
MEGKIEERKKEEEEELSGPCNSASHLFHVLGGHVLGGLSLEPWGVVLGGCI